MASQALLAAQAEGRLTSPPFPLVLPLLLTALRLKPGTGAARVAAQYKEFDLELPAPKLFNVIRLSQEASRFTTGRELKSNFWGIKFKKCK